MLDETQWIEAEAWRDLAEGAPGWLRTALGIQTLRWGRAMLLSSRRIDSAAFNRVIGLERCGAPDPRIVDEIVRHYEFAGVEDFLVHLATPQPRWTSLLRAHGLRPYFRPWIKLARGREGAVPSIDCDYTIDVARPDDATAYAQVLARGLQTGDSSVPLFAATVGRPRWTVMVARDGDRVVGGAALFVADGIANLAGTSTLPRYRCRGIQGALMARRIELALDLGCRVIGSETGIAIEGEPNSSENNMRRCGLQLVGTVDNYTRPQAQWAPRFRARGETPRLGS